jgi:hypothetical protein
MNNPIFIACDNEDAKLGRFFQSCFDTVREAAVANSVAYKSLMTAELTKDVINQHTAKADEYVFSAFSHGDDNALLCGKERYVEADDNVKNFYSSVFYTFACLTANGIGKEFREAYVQGYFGYKRPAWVVYAQEEMFVECATKGLVSYIEGKTLKQCAEDLIATYNSRLEKAKMTPAYAYLLKNKQSLVTIINSEDKTIND